MSSDIEICLGKKAPESIEELIGVIFWKKKSMIPKAIDFLDHIREWSRTENPYMVSEWDKYCIRARISQGSYHNMLKRLRNAGLIEKRYNKYKRVHELHPIDKFSANLRQTASIWDRYLIE